MFGGPPPQVSVAEIRAREDEAVVAVQQVLFGAILLYLSPFAVHAVKKLI
ncbi:mitochondrial outer membrane translocase complex, subunit Tom5 [Calycina marina]|uniref:Mitochondrial outer membrane translocase complex, subunit Tom5 n=1 Tax=Calycina marina TaxID=1763456 RepID=A0A9P7YUL4_9HELO|nr:mitochondrial outer membrane translocase complex, subunit Tom5 [Calycina marina]